MKSHAPMLALLLAVPAFGQANAVPGTDINIYEVGSPTVYRRGTYPNGEAGVVIGHSMCNNGTVHLPWLGWVGGSSGSVMLDTYPKIAFLLVRESNGRMVQISGKSFLKHSRVAYNFSSTNPCGTCQSGPSQHFRMGCYDVYSTGFNGNRNNLGPTTEINPWLGSWNPVGSYFDRGDPAVSGPAATDGIQSLTTSGWDNVKNRMEVQEQDLLVPGTFRGQCHLMIKGEPVANRGNNLVSRGLTFAWNGSSWTSSLSGSSSHGSVLNHWTGATTSMAGNGMDDGRFLVAVKVTGPVNGMWHYEYAVHNIDNDRGGASLRIPVCDGARVENIGFHDIDQDPLNEWTVTRNAGELAFLATAGNPLDWNTLYNFWFDSDAAPVAGSVDIDQARIGAGALSVNVGGTQVPGLLGNVHLGDGCGAPAPALHANGAPTSPNAAYALRLQLAPSNFALLAFAQQAVNLPLGNGCTLLVDNNVLLGTYVVQGDGVGNVTWPLPIPAALSPTDIAVQAFEFVTNGPMLGFLEASNGVLVRAGGTGCN
jgi:hypothetical protein